MKLPALATNMMNKRWVAFPVTVLRRFGHDNGGLIAAGLSFFMLLSLAPLLLTGAAMMAFFIHDPAQVSREVEQIVQGLLPSGGAQVAIGHLIARRFGVDAQLAALVRGRTLAGVMGLLTLVWTSMQVFVNAAVAMNAAFEITERRSWLEVRGVALALMFVSGVLIVFTLFLTAAPSAVEDFGNGYFPGVTMPPWLLTVVFELLAVMVNALLYVILFQYLPSTGAGWRPALAGGLTASILWEIAKKGLASWLLRANHTIYGDLANVILFALWIYYSMVILLIGAEVAAVVQKSRDRESAPVDRAAAAPLSA